MYTLLLVILYALLSILTGIPPSFINEHVAAYMPM